MKKLFGLGKGLDSLIPASKQTMPRPEKENVFYVEINKVKPNPQQPRQDFDNDGIKELSKSIRKYGVLQPLLVSKIEESSNKGLHVYYQLIAGERRLRAAKLAGIPTIPVIIRDDIEQNNGGLEVALIENIQRKNLNPIEEAEAYEKLQSQFNLTQQEIGDKVSKSRESIANILRLLKLSPEIKESMRAGILSMAHGRALLAFSDQTKQKEVFNQILTGRMPTKEVEKLAASLNKPRVKEAVSVRAQSKFIELEKNLSSTLKAPVLIRSSDRGGKIMIKFMSLKELNRIVKDLVD